jgi:hypothetical protein
MKRSRFGEEQVSRVLRETEAGTSLSRACRLVWISRSLQAYRSRRPGQEGLRVRMRELAQARPRYGYRRILCDIVCVVVNMRACIEVFRRRRAGRMNAGGWTLSMMHSPTVERSGYSRSLISGVGGVRSWTWLKVSQDGRSRRRSIARLPSTASRTRSLSLTARSSLAACSISGRTNGACCST